MCHQRRNGRRSHVACMMGPSDVVYAKLLNVNVSVNVCGEEEGSKN